MARWFSDMTTASLQATSVAVYRACGKLTCGGHTEFSSKVTACGICPPGQQVPCQCIRFVLQCLFPSGESERLLFQGAGGSFFALIVLTGGLIKNIYYKFLFSILK